MSKTTTVGKLTRLLKNEQKKKVLVVSADMYRPATVGQLCPLAERVGIDFFLSSSNQKSAETAMTAIDYARKYFYDISMVGTARRSVVDEEMMNEIKALHAVVDPVETLFVVDAMLGRDAANMVQVFDEALPLTGAILTKTDGDSRGGVILSVRQTTGGLIKFIGAGKKITGLEPLHPDRIASRILDMGDVLSLIEDI